MAKKKKPARRNDVRGYGQAKPSPPTGPAAEAAAAKVQVTTKTHDGLKDLLGTLEGGATAKKRNTAPTSAVESDRFAGKLSNVVTRLEELGFSDESITRVVQAIKYDLTLDTALDWLCLQLTTEELPALFTEVHVRETSLQIQADDSSLTVLKLSAPVVLPTSMEASSSSRSETEFNLTVAAAATTTTAAAPKPSETKVEPSKEEQDAAQARKAWLLAQYAYEENDDSGNEEKGTTNDVLEKEETLVVVEKEKVAAAVAAAALSPQEQDLLKAENELKEMEADYNDEANNYMRSKLETKQLGLQVKNLRKQVQGLRKKVQKQKPKQVVNDDTAIDIGASANAMPLDAAVAAPAPELEDAEGAGCGGIFDMFNEANTETPAISSAEPTDGDESQEDNEPQVDYSIPKDWTGTTPTKTLDEWCKKRKLLRPKYIKIPRNQGGGYRLAVHVQKKGKPQEYKQSASGFIGNAQEYIALQALYALEPTLPLYRVFPLVFRDLWLSWVGEIQLAKDQVKHEETTAQREKIDRLLALIESSSSTNGAAKKAFGESKQQPSAAKSGQEEDDNITEPVFESWEDDDTHADTQDEIATTKRKAPSAASTKLKDLFVKRQSTAAYQEMKKVRTSLPMHGFRENVLDIIRDNPVTVLCAETGAGKTTQCPQYLLEDALLHGRGDAVNILCTQPRRVAATSVAERVAEEMCEPSIGQMVGYQIRMEAKRSSRTKLLFCTTGIVLRRLQEDSTLKGVSHVIVDEVHERQQQTDVLLIALRRLLNTARPDLKVILVGTNMFARKSWRSCHTHSFLFIDVCYSRFRALLLVLPRSPSLFVSGTRRDLFCFHPSTFN
jgi:ATP-dependent RNA helicase DHX29